MSAFPPFVAMLYLWKSGIVSKKNKICPRQFKEDGFKREYWIIIARVQFVWPTISFTMLGLNMWMCNIIL